MTTQISRVALTDAQRSYLEFMSRQPIASLDIKGGAQLGCMKNLMKRGLAKAVRMPDFRDDTYQITDAGRAALNER